MSTMLATVVGAAGDSKMYLQLVIMQYCWRCNSVHDNRHRYSPLSPVLQLALASLSKAVQYATLAGVTVVGAAGDYALDFNTRSNLVAWPAHVPGVITIGATGPNRW